MLLMARPWVLLLLSYACLRPVAGDLEPWHPSNASFGPIINTSWRDPSSMDFDTVLYNTTSAAPIIVPWDGDRSVSPFTVRIFTNGAPLPDSTPGSEILKVFNHPVGADHVTAHVNGNLVRWIPSRVAHRFRMP